MSCAYWCTREEGARARGGMRYRCSRRNGGLSPRAVGKAAQDGCCRAALGVFYRCSIVCFGETTIVTDALKNETPSGRGVGKPNLLLRGPQRRLGPRSGGGRPPTLSCTRRQTTPNRNLPKPEPAPVPNRGTAVRPKTACCLAALTAMKSLSTPKKNSVVIMHGHLHLDSPNNVGAAVERSHVERSHVVLPLLVQVSLAGDVALHARHVVALHGLDHIHPQLQPPESIEREGRSERLGRDRHTDGERKVAVVCINKRLFGTSCM